MVGAARRGASARALEGWGAGCWACNCSDGQGPNSRMLMRRVAQADSARGRCPAGRAVSTAARRAYLHPAAARRAASTARTLGAAHICSPTRAAGAQSLRQVRRACLLASHSDHERKALAAAAHRAASTARMVVTASRGAPMHAEEARSRDSKRGARMCTPQQRSIINNSTRGRCCAPMCDSFSNHGQRR